MARLSLIDHVALQKLPIIGMGRKKLPIMQVESVETDAVQQILSAIDTDSNSRNRITSAIITTIASHLSEDSKYCSRVVKCALRSSDIKTELFYMLADEKLAHEVYHHTHLGLQTQRKKSRPFALIAYAMKSNKNLNCHITIAI
jgi:hypothetical protein